MWKTHNNEYSDVMYSWRMGGGVLGYGKKKEKSPDKGNTMSGNLGGNAELMLLVVLTMTVGCGAWQCQGYKEG